MNPFLLDPYERLKEWKKCRDSLNNHSENEQLSIVSEFWMQAPLSSISYDVTDASTWADPWSMMHANEWNELSRAIGIDFTLRLGGWDASRLKLILANDLDISETIMVVEIDNSLILNYDMRKPVLLSDRHWTIIGSWQFSHKFYEPFAS